MKVFLLAVLSVVSFQLIGQEPSISLLHVSGKAEASVKPTLTIVSLAIRSSKDTYAGAVEDLTGRVDLLAKVLKDQKFQDDQIITSNFSVDKNYAYIDGQRKATGYNGVQTLKVQFEQDKARLLAVLTAATSSQADPEISVSFDLDDETKARLKEELMVAAVSDATSKAKLIAEQANHQLAGIREIKYGLASEEISFPSGEMFQMATRGDVQVNTFEVSDLTLTDQVLIVFKIAPK